MLYPSSRNPPAWIGKIHGISFCDTSSLSSPANPKSNIQNPSSSASIACFSINRAKGLERRAIILTGLPSWEKCEKNDYQARTFVLGATRAQQLLAITSKNTQHEC